MTKMMKKQLKRSVKVKRPTKMRVQTKTAPKTNFGAVSSINTAPVAIGNSIRGARSQTFPTKNGVRVIGRDFMFSAVGSGSITTWTLVGGTPLTPVSFGDSIVRQYMQMYQKYRRKRCIVHYITSSSTASTGDVLFYHSKNRDSVFLNQTSAQFLPFVISDPDTVLGPQWVNHSADLTVQGSWKSTDYGMSDAPNDYSDGDVFLLSKTSTTDSPGYVVFDYEIEFAEMQITPRLLALPLPRAQWFNTTIGANGNVTAGNPVYYSIAGNNISGTAATAPTGITAGDIYKVILDITNSTGTYTGGSYTNSTFAAVKSNGGNNSLVLVDGSTIYATYNADATFLLWPSATAAYAAGNDYLVYNTSITAVTTVRLTCWLSLVGSISNLNINPNF